MSSNINLLYIIKSYNDVVFINSDKKNVRKVMQEEDFKVQKVIAAIGTSAISAVAATANAATTHTVKRVNQWQFQISMGFRLLN